MSALKIAALGLLLAATVAEAQKAPAGQANAGGKPAPSAGTATSDANPAAVPEPGADTGTEVTTPAVPDPEALILASDPQGVVAAMQALGYTATLGTDSVGDPTITGAIDGIDYNVFFYGCQDNANCQWLIFNAGFDLPNGSTAEVVNTWNQNNLVGQAFLDAQQDPILNYFVTTTGGLTPDNFADVIDWWDVALGEFRTAIGY